MAEHVIRNDATRVRFPVSAPNLTEGKETSRTAVTRTLRGASPLGQPIENRNGCRYYTT